MVAVPTAPPRLPSPADDNFRARDEPGDWYSGLSKRLRYIESAGLLLCTTEKCMVPIIPVTAHALCKHFTQLHQDTFTQGESSLPPHVLQQLVVDFGIDTASVAGASNCGTYVVLQRRHALKDIIPLLGEARKRYQCLVEDCTALYASASDMVHKHIIKDHADYKGHDPGDLKRKVEESRPVLSQALYKKVPTGVTKFIRIQQTGADHTPPQSSDPEDLEEKDTDVSLDDQTDIPTPACISTETTSPKALKESSPNIDAFFATPGGRGDLPPPWVANLHFDKHLAGRRFSNLSPLLRAWNTSSERRVAELMIKTIPPLAIRYLDSLAPALHNQINSYLGNVIDEVHDPTRLGLPRDTSLHASTALFSAVVNTVLRLWRMHGPSSEQVNTTHGRPLVLFTPQQSKHLSDLHEYLESSSPGENNVALLLAMLTSLVDNIPNDNHLTSPLLCAMAINSLIGHPASTSWRTPTCYAETARAVAWHVQILLVITLYNKQIDSEQAATEAEPRWNALAIGTPSHAATLATLRAWFPAVEGGYGAQRSVADWCQAISASVSSPGMPGTVPRKATETVPTGPRKQSQAVLPLLPTDGNILRQMVHASIIDLTTLLARLLFVNITDVEEWDPSLSSETWARIRATYTLPPILDDPSDESDGANAVTITGWDGSHAALDTQLGRASVRLEGNGQLPGHHIPLLRRDVQGPWAKNLHQFTTKLLVLVNLTSGLPLAATEIVTLRHSNTEQAGQRNMFYEADHELWGFRCARRRAQSHVRYLLPPSLSAIFTHYLFLVLPLSHAQFDTRIADTPFLNLGHPGQQHELDAAAQWTLLETIYNNETDREGRPGTLAEEIRTITCMDKATDVCDEFAPFARIADDGAGNTRVAFAASQIQPVRDNHVRRELAEIAGLYGRKASFLDCRRLLAARCGHTPEDPTHNTSGLPGLPMSTTSTEGSDTTFALCLRIHLLLELTDLTKVRARPGTPQAISLAHLRGTMTASKQYAAEAQDARILTLESRLRMDPEPSLRGLVGLAGAFRAGQREALAACVSGWQTVVCVMPPGAGRRVLPPLIAKAAPGKMLIVTSETSVQDTIIAEARSLGINADVLTRTSLPWINADGEIRIMVTTPDVLRHPAPATRISILTEQCSLDHVVFVGLAMDHLDRNTTLYKPPVLYLPPLLASAKRCIFLLSFCPPALAKTIGHTIHEYKQGRFPSPTLQMAGPGLSFTPPTKTNGQVQSGGMRTSTADGNTNPTAHYDVYARWATLVYRQYPPKMNIKYAASPYTHDDIPDIAQKISTYISQAKKFSHARRVLITTYLDVARSAELADAIDGITTLYQQTHSRGGDPTEADEMRRVLEDWRLLSSEHQTPQIIVATADQAKALEDFADSSIIVATMPVHPYTILRHLDHAAHSPRIQQAVLIYPHNWHSLRPEISPQGPFHEASLRAILDFSTTRGCRHAPLDLFFDDVARPACRASQTSTCDNCEARGQATIANTRANIITPPSSSPGTTAYLPSDMDGSLFDIPEALMSSSPTHNRPTPEDHPQGAPISSSPTRSKSIRATPGPQHRKRSSSPITLPGTPPSKRSRHEANLDLIAAMGPSPSPKRQPLTASHLYEWLWFLGEAAASDGPRLYCLACTLEDPHHFNEHNHGPRDCPRLKDFEPIMETRMAEYNGSRVGFQKGQCYRCGFASAFSWRDSPEAMKKRGVFCPATSIQNCHESIDAGYQLGKTGGWRLAPLLILVAAYIAPADFREGIVEASRLAKVPPEVDVEQHARALTEMCFGNTAGMTRDHRMQAWSFAITEYQVIAPAATERATNGVAILNFPELRALSKWASTGSHPKGISVGLMATAYAWGKALKRSRDPQADRFASSPFS